MAQALLASRFMYKVQQFAVQISTARREAAAARKQLGEFLENLDLSMVKLAGASEALIAHKVREGLVELDKRMWEMRYVGAELCIQIRQQKTNAVQRDFPLCKALVARSFDSLRGQY